MLVYLFEDFAIWAADICPQHVHGGNMQTLPESPASAGFLPKIFFGRLRRTSGGLGQTQQRNGRSVCPKTSADKNYPSKTIRLGLGLGLG